MRETLKFKLLLPRPSQKTPNHAIWFQVFWGLGQLMLDSLTVF